MRILVAPDKYAGTLTAVEAAEAIAAGWRRTAVHDEIDRCPLSDGGPGFVDALHAALGGELVLVPVPGLDGAVEPATILRVGTSAYVEAAQVLGRTGGTEPVRTAPEHRSSHPLGRLIGHAVEDGATRVVVGVGGTLTNDGGAGLLAALGARAQAAQDAQDAQDAGLDGGFGALGTLTGVDLEPVRSRLAGVELVAATDVDNPLTGLFGASKVFGAQKGLSEESQLQADAALQHLAELTDRVTATLPGAGAGGGVGFALLLAGGTRRPGLAVVAEAVGLADRIGRADLVLTGEGSFDASSRGGKVPVGVAALAGERARPCVVLAGRVGMGAREHRSLGVESAYAVVDVLGEERALRDPSAALADLAERVARTWSPAE
ncbi:glycerate kinase [Nocardioides sp. BP30]|uniref:glycerate kinase family protein n=1 Tax=Nocardioides sp. BP30 TaxID=3036374 RepID=UPI0024693E55|nr:glycerate kinase [Nocardioides sp. BP30]WGL53781.1 glycerate kinase [Nocardioides sp. BP30]